MSTTTTTLATGASMGDKCAMFIKRIIRPNDKVSDGSQPPTPFESPLGVPAGARSLDRLVRRFSYQVCEILVDDHLGKLNGVQILAMLPGQLLIPYPHAAKALVDRRSQLQPLTHRGSPIVAATKDTLNRGASQRLFVWRQLANAIKHVVLQND